jgi:hypothetical protein
MKIETEYNLSEIVFLITDNEQLQRIITGIQISCNQVVYRLACGTVESWHYDFEFVKEKTFKL